MFFWPIGEIITRFERKGFQIVGLKMFKTLKSLAEVTTCCCCYCEFVTSVGEFAEEILMCTLLWLLVCRSITVS